MSKIHYKTNINASEGIPLTVQEEAPTVNCKFQPAMDLIKLAIDSLAAEGPDDEVARESIANLSVVLLDLKGC